MALAALAALAALELHPALMARMGHPVEQVPSASCKPLEGAEARKETVAVAVVPVLVAFLLVVPLALVVLAGLRVLAQMAASAPRVL